tara:strand:- start:77721 stop:77945 length:225 start_codon:yes stop_codon:yes gene_type:complete
MYQVVLIENELPSKDAFVKAFNKETGGDFKKLMSNSPTRDSDTCLYWDVMMPNGNYELKYCADNPFFILSKEVE